MRLVIYELYVVCCQVRKGVLNCYHKQCTFSSHITCFASMLTAEQAVATQLVPVSGPCPKCSRDLLWGELIRRYRGGCHV